jgi:hypothetical protein
MILISLLKYIGLTEFASSLLLNFFGLIYIGSFLKENYQKVIFLLALIATPFIYSALSGFSTLFFSAIFLACLNNVLSSLRLLCPLILLLCLTRPDGVVFGIGCILLRFYLNRNINFYEIKNQLVDILIILIIPGILYFLWRWWYFSEILPLPFYVKSGHPTNLWIFYKHSILDLVEVTMPFLLTILIFRDKFTCIKFILIFSFSIFFYSSFVLEQNVGNRFMAPYFFGCLFLLLNAKKISQRTTSLIIYLILIVSLQINSTVGIINYLIDTKNENIIFLAKDLDVLDGKMLVTEAGRLAHYNHWLVDDGWGLNSPKFSKKQITEEDLSARSYDLINAHCPLGYLKPDSNLPIGNYRSWGGMCISITNYIKNNHYIIYFVPYKKSANNECIRHDIYAVKPEYSNRLELESILIKNGGIIMTQGINYGEDDKICSNSR